MHIELTFLAVLAPALAQGEPSEAADRRVDRALAKVDALAWYDIRRLDIEGKGWTDTKDFYDRLPAGAEGVVRAPVWSLSRDSAGLCARFETDATALSARWTLRSESLAMPHMAATGVSGLDLYVKGTDGKWKWLAAGKPTAFPANSTALVSGIPEGRREYLLYLPLYNGVTEVEVGLPKDATLWKAPPYPAGRKPIVFYGTSITQGGCASRSGMVHTAILGRRLGYPVINLGFSGNGRMEAELAALLAELDPSVYVLDCLPNMDAALVAERVGPFVRTLRNARPETPILLVEDRSYSNAIFVPASARRNEESRRELRKAYFRLTASGVGNLHYLPGNRLLGEDRDNLGTVDGSHPTDLGFLRQADVFHDALGPILLGPAASSALEEEWKRTKPDIVVFLPKGAADGDNEHFQVFEAPESDELLAMWTQSSVEGRGDNRIAFARSLDGVAWSDPVILAGRGPGRRERQASWAFPVVAACGRIYCFYTKELEKIDVRQSSGAMGVLYSDDNGFSWSAGADVPVPKTRYDNPDPEVPPNWIVWQKPVRDAGGRWIVGCTRTTSEKVIPKPNRNWPDHDSRSVFIRFDNLDAGPDPKDLALTWLPAGSDGLEVPHKLYPEISVCQEPAVVLLPDGRLFSVMRTMTGSIWYSVSEDDGATWRPVEVLRYRDGGEHVENPIAPCPLYRLADGRYLLVFNNNDGRRGAYDQFRKTWRANQLNHLRHPAFIAIGEFRSDAHQPIWFSPPKQILDTNGVTFGPKGTASVAMYPSLTERNGVRVLWYPDRKHFLLGKLLPDSLLDAMKAPR